MAEAITVSTESELQLQPGEHRLHFTLGASVIELARSVPDSPTAGLAIVCHPHPLMGGTMDNKVVTTVARTFRDQGQLAIRLNFRGVGASTGVFDHGMGEQEDVMQVARWAQRQFQLPWRFLAGFSFGAFVALRVHNQLPSNAASLLLLCLIAPPVTRFELSSASLAAGTEIIYGDADEVVEPSAIKQWLETAPTDIRITTMVGAGHFFHGRLGELKEWTHRVCDNYLMSTREELG